MMIHHIGTKQHNLTEICITQVQPSVGVVADQVLG